jgi:spoIIIJ-associated protein
VSELVSVEATGETVGEAKWAALRELEKKRPGLDKSAVKFEVVSEGERGLLGVGYTPARVVAAIEVGEEAPELEPPVALVAPAPPEPASELGAEVREVVEHVARSLGIDCRVGVAEDDERITATCIGGDLGILIGRHGQTIDSLQYLVNAIVHRTHGDERKEVVVDAAGYRERRRATLEALAVRTAERVLAGDQRVELDPMTAVERKVVHLRLKEFPGVATTSEGTEPNRYVVVTRSE